MEPLDDLTEELNERLDWHYRADASLERLRRQLRSAPRPRARVLPQLRRLGAVAALLLVLFGLALGLAPLGSPPVDGFEVVASLLPRASRGDPEALALPRPAKEVPATTLRLQKRGSPDAVPSGVVPLGPPVEVVLTVTNHGATPLVLDAGGERTLLRLDLRGPGTFRRTGTRVEGETALPFLTAETVRLEPGKTWTLPLTHLVGGRRGALEGVYADRPGRYELWARYRVTAREELGRPRDLYVRAGPILLDVLGQR